MPCNEPKIFLLWNTFNFQNYVDLAKRTSIRIKKNFKITVWLYLFVMETLIFVVGRWKLIGLVDRAKRPSTKKQILEAIRMHGCVVPPFFYIQQTELFSYRPDLHLSKLANNLKPNRTWQRRIGETFHGILKYNFLHPAESLVYRNNNALHCISYSFLC